MKGWITAVPKGKLILLDLMAEESPLWQRSESYYGAPFIWCMLNDFGGNNGMWGDFPSLSTGPSDARKSGSTIVGVGLTPEGIWQNAAAYDFMNENAYVVALSDNALLTTIGSPQNQIAPPFSSPCSLNMW